jgi:Tol biopolymer transport system component
MEVNWPHISPDGKRVEFMGGVPGKGDGTYIVDMSGGEPRFVVSSRRSSAWSCDGRSLLVSIQLPGKGHWDLDSVQLASWDIETGKVSTIPDSQAKDGAFCSAEMIIASGGDTLYMFDKTTQQWSKFADGPISNYMISPDSKYIYFVRENPADPVAMRVRIADRKVETITSLHNSRRVSDPSRGDLSWIGVAPDGSLLLTRDTSTQEIYSLHVKWP